MWTFPKTILERWKKFSEKCLPIRNHCDSEAIFTTFTENRSENTRNEHHQVPILFEHKLIGGLLKNLQLDTHLFRRDCSRTDCKKLTELEIEKFRWNTANDRKSFKSGSELEQFEELKIILVMWSRKRCRQKKQNNYCHFKSEKKCSAWSKRVRHDNSLFFNRRFLIDLVITLQILLLNS